MEPVRVWLAEHYLTLKFAHVLSVMLWGFTAIGAFWWLIVAHVDARRHPEDAELARRRRWAFARFGQVVVIEHVCFPLVLVTGAALWWVADWPLSGSWLSWKLYLVLGVFVPMEIADTWLSHWHLPRALRAGDAVAAEAAMRLHGRFLAGATGLVAVALPWTIWLAVTKPF